MPQYRNALPIHSPEHVTPDQFIDAGHALLGLGQGQAQDIARSSGADMPTTSRSLMGLVEANLATMPVSTRPRSYAASPALTGYLRSLNDLITEHVYGSDQTTRTVVTAMAIRTFLAIQGLYIPYTDPDRVGERLSPPLPGATIVYRGLRACLAGDTKRPRYTLNQIFA